jgi:hypothetical protein
LIHSKSYDTPSIPDQSARNQIFWIGTLQQGEHTIKGRFASPYGLSTVTVDNRILLIYIFNGTGFKFTESSIVRTTSSGELSDDNESVINYFLLKMARPFIFIISAKKVLVHLNGLQVKRPLFPFLLWIIPKQKINERG